MRKYWNHKTVSSSEDVEAEVHQMGWEEAQSWCNFVLMKPRNLPGDLELERAQMRPEAPPGRPEHLEQQTRPAWTQSNRAVHRVEYVGHGRRLRIKQFFYDYAPAAFDHPCLWESEKVHPFHVNQHIGWIGRDFRKLQAATINLDRTTVELSVTSGVFTDGELKEICVSLSPVLPEVRARILATPFSELCYQSRHREPPIAVPVGYWAHKRLPESLKMTVQRAADVQADTSVFAILPLGEYGYQLDSVFIYGELKSPQEKDYIFQHSEDVGRFVRLLVSPSESPGAIPYPPERELRQPCTSQIIEIGDCRVYHAYYDERYGQHEAVWQKSNHNFMLIIKPTIESNMAWFTEFLKKIVDYS